MLSWPTALAAGAGAVLGGLGAFGLARARASRPNPAGEPLIVYHGTHAAFDPTTLAASADGGFHFGTKEPCLYG